MVVWPQFRWIGSVPDALYAPPAISLAALLDGFPPLEFFVLIDVLVLLSTVTLTLGYRTRISTATLLLAVLAGNHFQFSFGKIDHASSLYLAVLAVMLVSNRWGRRSALRPVEGAPGSETTTLKALRVLMAFGFFSAGWGKALSWIDFDLTTSGVAAWVLRDFHTLGRSALLAPLAHSVSSPLVWELADYSAVAFELSILVAILRRDWWYLWLTVACLFHMVNVAVLNISFLHLSIVYLAFVPWSSLIGEISPRRVQAVGIAVAIAAGIRWLRPRGGGLLAVIPQGGHLYVAIAIWLASFACLTWAWKAGTAGAARSPAVAAPTP